MIKQFSVLMDELAVTKATATLNSGYIGQGPKVEEFEKELKKLMEFRYGVTVNSGTSALHLALHLVDVRTGYEVISTPMTCSATNEAIAMTGAKIVWADVDQYGNIDPKSIVKLITNKTKAVMAVDWGGLPCDYDEIRNALKGTTIPIIQDAAHSYLSTYKNKPITKRGGDYQAYSFQAIKHLTCGDGGLLVLPSVEQYERAKLLRWYGLDRENGDQSMRCKQDIKEAGFKYHMNDINASIGLGNLYVSKISVAKARANAKYFDSVFLERGLLPYWPVDRESSFWLYTIHVPNPDVFEKFMESKGIQVSQVHNRNDRFSCFLMSRKTLPNLDQWFSTMICLPVGWWLTEDDLDWIASCTLEWRKIGGSL